MLFIQAIPVRASAKGDDSKLSRAELLVRQWENILKVHEERLPEAVIPCRVMLDGAKKNVESLRLDPANAIKV
jgi:hypothetical protein